MAITIASRPQQGSRESSSVARRPTRGPGRRARHHLEAVFAFFFSFFSLTLSFGLFVLFGRCCPLAMVAPWFLRGRALDLVYSVATGNGRGREAECSRIPIATLLVASRPESCSTTTIADVSRRFWWCSGRHARCSSAPRVPWIQLRTAPALPRVVRASRFVCRLRGFIVPRTGGYVGAKSHWEYIDSTHRGYMVADPRMSGEDRSSRVPLDGVDAMRAYTLKYINALRARHRRGPLVLDPGLNAFAQEGSVELSRNHLPHHHAETTPCGCAENQAAPDGWAPGPIDVQIAEILAGDAGRRTRGGHHDNMLAPAWHRLGVGIVNPGGRMYFTTDFAP